MEQQTNDVFQVSVGNIPPREQVQIELLYATELAEDEDSDSIRFHLPFQIGARYGNAPAPPTPFTATSALTSRSTPFLIISANVEAVAPIAKIGSPSHTISTELGPDPALPNFEELPFSNYARVSLSSDSTLKKDFVLTVKSAGLDAPRCVAEPHPTHNTAALALSFVPRFTLPDLARQEFILLVDRSGSMANKRITAARKALVILLRALPHEDTLFQIVSFGSRASALWPTGSRAYDQGTLEEATRHVDGMDADYGGTEIRRALGKCFKERAGDRPTSVLVLTDGEAWDTEGVLADVKAAVRAAPEDAPLRVSVLGIGDSVSTAMCEGIARLGNGTCMLVAEEETTFTGKVARLLKAARTPVISNITVDWGREADEPEDDFEVVEKEEMAGAKAAEAKQKTLNIFDETVDPTHLDKSAAPPASQVILPPPPAVQQSPLRIHNLFPGTRVNIYAILKGKSSIPTTVTLRGATPDGASITLDIPVTLSRLPSTPALHALAARKIIQDLVDGQHPAVLTATFKNPGDADLLARTVRASIVRLGTTYAISSVHTSFVAVDEANADAAAAPQEQAPPSYTVRTSPPTYVDSYDSGVQAQARGGSSYSASRAYSYDPSIIAVFHAYVPTVTAEYDPTIEDIPTVGPGSWDYDPTVDSVDVYQSQEEYSVPRRPADRARGRPATPADIRSAALTSDPASAKKSKVRTGLISTLFSSMTRSVSKRMSMSGTSAPVENVVQKRESVNLSSSSAPRMPTPNLGSMGGSFGAWSPPPLKAAAVVEDHLEALARLQSFDGAFPASRDVLAVPGLSLKKGTTVEDVRRLLPSTTGTPDQEKLLASVLAMAFAGRMRAAGGQAGADRDAWEGMYGKVRAWVVGALRGLGPGVVEAVSLLEEKVAGLLAAFASAP